MSRARILVLDEIGDLTLATQVKLNRALQEKEIRRVGDNTPVAIDVRVVAATHRDLRQEVRDGRFREDLFYRLNVYPIQLPYRDAVELARERVSREYLTALLREFGGNVTHAAQRAGLERESLHRLLRRYGIRPDDFRREGT